jgi:tripartite-type tricarboxylate transporter receptor subunit TctC
MYSIAAPDGLTLAMPGRSGFLLAPVTNVGDVKYDLRKFTWIGSSASTNYILWLRKALGIHNLDELKRAKEPVIIGGSGAGTANSVVPDVLAKYDGLPFKIVRGYSGMSTIAIAMERGEADGLFASRASLRPDLITSGAFVPIFQTFESEPNLPSVGGFVTNPHEKALLNLLDAPLRVGLPMVAPPGLPDNITAILRKAYFEMVSSEAYRAEAAKRGFELGTPSMGDELAAYVAENVVSVAPDVLQEYQSYVGRN